MSSKLDYLKKYTGGAKQSAQELLKKRLLKQYTKDKPNYANSGFKDDDVIALGVKKTDKQLQNNNKKPLHNKRQFTEEEENDNQEEEEDEGLQPVIEGEDLSNLTNEQRKQLLQTGNLNTGKQSGKWVTEEKEKKKDDSSSDSSDSSEDEKRKKRRRHDSSDSSGSEDEQINTESKKVKVDADGDISLSDGDQVVGEQAGLQSVDDLKKFNKIQAEKQNKELMEQILKQGQQKTIFRTKDGKIMSEAEKNLNEKDRIRLANEEQMKLWKGGFKQQQEKEERKQAIQNAKDKPFANYDLDPEADKELKMKDRFGDPLKLIKSSTMKSKINQQTYRVITTANGQRYILPKCKFPGTHNRIGIEPGHRWDGVDRSNGYERKWVEKENANKDNQEYFRKWAQEDM